MYRYIYIYIHICRYCAGDVYIYTCIYLYIYSIYTCVSVYLMKSYNLRFPFQSPIKSQRSGEHSDLSIWSPWCRRYQFVLESRPIICQTWSINEPPPTIVQWTCHSVIVQHVSAKQTFVIVWLILYGELWSMKGKMHTQIFIRSPKTHRVTVSSQRLFFLKVFVMRQRPWYLLDHFTRTRSLTVPKHTSWYMIHLLVGGFNHLEKY